jgi:hypothetical protein
MKRRQILGGLAAAPLLPSFARADTGAGRLTLLVGGPDGEQTSRWGDACALAMAGSFPGDPQIVTQTIGGWDGLAGANRLDALVIPDGKTAAILPGGVLIAFLTGDSRVHYDPTRWTPLLAGNTSGVLMVRAPAQTQLDVDALRTLAPLHLAADQPESRDLAALLALTRLNVPVVPVFGLRNTDAKMRAFVAGRANAVFLTGEGVPEDVAAFTAAGAVPVFSIGMMDSDGVVGPDPSFPDLPEAMKFGNSATSFLDNAYRAVAAAARLDFMLVLPRLTDANGVAMWSSAVGVAASSEAFVAAARASAVILQRAPLLGSALATLSIEAPDQGTLQAFMAKSYGWQPS